MCLGTEHHRGWTVEKALAEIRAENLSKKPEARSTAEAEPNLSVCYFKSLRLSQSRIVALPSTRFSFPSSAGFECSRPKIKSPAPRGQLDRVVPLAYGAALRAPSACVHIG